MVDFKYEHEAIEYVQQNGLNLKNVENKTEKICLTAVIQNGLALQYVPSQFKTISVIWSAILENFFAIKYMF
jgi:hypothetical protein